MNEFGIADSDKVNKAGEPVMKPKTVLDYSINMRQVDKNDMQIVEWSALEKLKWYKIVFMHLVDVALYNTYNL